MEPVNGNNGSHGTVSQKVMGVVEANIESGTHTAPALEQHKGTKTLVRKARIDKATPGTVRYKESVPETEPPTFRNIYLPKYVLRQPYPDEIEVVVKIPVGVDAAGKS